MEGGFSERGWGGGESKDVWIVFYQAIGFYNYAYWILYL